MTTPQRELADALQEAASAILDGPDPAGAISSLRAWSRRRAAFNASPAAVPASEIADARASGVPLHLAATRRVYVNDQKQTKGSQP